MSDAKEGGEDQPNRIMVYLRIRPPNPGEIDPSKGTDFLLDVQPDNKTCLLESKSYAYDWVFNGTGVQQEDIYKKVAEPVIDNVFKGFWGTVMVYGQTGTGKSFTMCNFDIRHQGIIPRTMRYIFDSIAKDTEREYSICFSFIQIYLDKLQDLFNIEGPELKINRDKDGVSFPGITEHTVKDADDFRRLYDDGNQHRVITRTKMNPESSRGHAALFIQVKSTPKDDPSGEIRSGKLFLIDLAGYERFSKTGVQEGLMAQEAKTINASLLSLGNVVQALSDRAEHIPWRNAKLTRMLEDAIGGKAKCSIILTAGPSNEHMHETLGTLYFGSRAMAVKTNAKLAVNVDYKKLAAKLQEMLNQAAGRINALEVEATQRQLEREEAESNFQAEWARVKKRQEEQLQQLLTNGASKEKIEELIRSNQQESELLEEQQYEQRQILEARHEQEVHDSLEKRQQIMQQSTEQSTANMSRDLSQLQKELAYERAEKEKFKTRAKEAESEARRLLTELNEAKMRLETSEVAESPASAGGAGSMVLSGDVRKELDRRIETVKAMLEDNFQLKLADVEEPLREELESYRKRYNDIAGRLESDLKAQKDQLTSSYEAEIVQLRATSAEVQEKLKKNHLTIKKSYQDQKDRVTRENEALSSYVDQLLAQLQKAGVTPAKRPVFNESGDVSGAASPQSVAGSTPNQKPGAPGSPSTDTDRLIQNLQQKIKDLQTELEYADTEKEAFAKQQSANFSVQTGEERLNPAQIRQLKAENDQLKVAKAAQDLELMKLKAAQLLSGPQEVSAQAEEDDDDDDQPEMLGDTEGLATFAQKMLARAYFDSSAFVNTHAQVASNLNHDLDDYRRILKYRLMLVGPPGSGKSSIVKCMLNNVPLLKATPDVAPSIHATFNTTAVDDLCVSKTDWHKAFVQFVDVESSALPSNQQSGGGFLGTLNPLNVFSSGQKGVADPAKVYIDLVDIPGDPMVWEGILPNTLPSKNVAYCITYDMTQPFDVVRDTVEAQLSSLHACVARSYGKAVGGNSPRTAFCLIGTHRDGMRDRSDAAVQSFLQKLISSLGDLFFRLRGEDTAGLICVGNFAVSARDWVVTSSKGDRGPKTFRELVQSLGMVLTQLYPNTPNHFLPSSKDTASHLSYMLGDDHVESAIEKTSHLLPLQQRMRKGLITLLTGLYREMNARWLISEADMRKLIVEHLGLDINSPFGFRCVNYVLRELAVRGVFFAMPSAILEPKYLPKCDDQDDVMVAPRTVLPRDGVLVMDLKQMMLLYTLFIAPKTIKKYKNNLAFIKDRSSICADGSALAALDITTTERGLISTDAFSAAFSLLMKFFNADSKLLTETLSILGLGTALKSETTVLSPLYFEKQVSNLATDYLSFLVSQHGDGLGRRYRLNATCPAFFHRLQTRLVPFSHAPVRDPSLNRLNWSNCSLLVLEKQRLKWGIFGSRALKEAVMQLGPTATARGILKMEGDVLYIAVTARSLPNGPTLDSASIVKATRTLLDAIHREIVTLCRRDFRGIKAQFQEVVLAGSAEKRQRLQEGIETILQRYELPAKEIANHKFLVSDFTEKGSRTVEEAILALRPEQLDEE